jgi:hypothetical protein
LDNSLAPSHANPNDDLCKSATELYADRDISPPGKGRVFGSDNAPYHVNPYGQVYGGEFCRSAMELGAVKGPSRMGMAGSQNDGITLGNINKSDKNVARQFCDRDNVKSRSLGILPDAVPHQFVNDRGLTAGRGGSQSQGGSVHPLSHVGAGFPDHALQPVAPDIMTTATSVSGSEHDSNSKDSFVTAKDRMSCDVSDYSEFGPCMPISSNGSSVPLVTTSYHSLTVPPAGSCNSFQWTESDVTPGVSISDLFPSGSVLYDVNTGVASLEMIPSNSFMGDFRKPAAILPISSLGIPQDKGVKPNRPQSALVSVQYPEICDNEVSGGDSVLHHLMPDQDSGHRISDMKRIISDERRGSEISSWNKLSKKYTLIDLGDQIQQSTSEPLLSGEKPKEPRKRYDSVKDTEYEPTRKGSVILRRKGSQDSHRTDEDIMMVELTASNTVTGYFDLCCIVGCELLSRRCCHSSRLVHRITTLMVCLIVGNYGSN